MAWIWLLILCLVFLAGAYFLWRSYLLLVQKNYSDLKSYKGTTESQLPSIAKYHGVLFLTVGLWFLVTPALIVYFHTPPIRWAQYFVVAAVIAIVGKYIIRKRHNLKSL